MITRIVVAFSILIQRPSAHAFAISPVPPLVHPLQYVSPLIALDYFLDTTASTLKDAILPSDLFDAVAVIASEGAAGALGGIAGKGLSIVDGNKNNQDNAITNAEASGAFFAIRSSLSSISTLVGMSTPLLGVIALVIATLLSEFIKMRARAIETEQKSVGDGPTMKELMRFRNYDSELMMGIPMVEQVPVPFLGKTSGSEVAADVTKWITYGVITPEDASVPLFLTIFYGAVSGIASQLVRDRDDAKECPAGETASLRMARASAEGAVQFLTYEVSRQAILAMVPNQDKMLVGFQEAAFTMASTAFDLVCSVPVQ